MKDKILFRIYHEVAYYPYYVLLVGVLTLWIGEGVAEQSGWLQCPSPPS